jgi:hypothetical protein
MASCSITPVSGHLTLTATFAGNAQYTAATASQAFSIAAPDSAAVPGVPTDISAFAGNGFISVSFAPPANDGGSPITSYTALCIPVTPGPSVSGSSGASPIAVFGVQSGVTYTCTVSASNAVGAGAPSAASTATIPGGVPSGAVTAIPVLGRAGEGILAALLTLAAFAALRRRGRMP